MFKKIATLAIASVAVIGLATTSASAKPKINPVAAGLVGAAVVGTAIVASQHHHHHRMHHRHCWLEPRQNLFGQVYYVRFCRWH